MAGRFVLRLRRGYGDVETPSSDWRIKWVDTKAIVRLLAQRVPWHRAPSHRAPALSASHGNGHIVSSTNYRRTIYSEQRTCNRDAVCCPLKKMKFDGADPHLFALPSLIQGETPYLLVPPPPCAKRCILVDPLAARS